jgi:hypothetical protein
VKALFDTNILIDYLNAIPEAREELNPDYSWVKKTAARNC